MRRCDAESRPHAEIPANLSLLLPSTRSWNVQAAVAAGFKYVEYQYPYEFGKAASRRPSRARFDRGAAPAAGRARPAILPAPANSVTVQTWPSNMHSRAVVPG